MIETELVRLRPFCVGDVSAVFRMSQEAGMRRWIPDQVYADEAQALRVVQFLIAQTAKPPAPQRAPYVLGVERKATGELIGHVGLSPLGADVEIGYAIAECHQGRGLATAAVTAATNWALEALAITRVLGIADSQNKGSRRVLEKSGFVLLREETREAFGRTCLCSIYQKNRPS